MDTEKRSLRQRVGCKECDEVGYRGRTAIFEILENTKEIRRGIKENGSLEELRQMAMENGMRTLRMDGVNKVLQGVTDLEEVLRVC
jgi:type II secretory ATPase GspE/PulE/Tfp pilus assembly ATPase PilB-like protein